MNQKPNNQITASSLSAAAQAQSAILQPQPQSQSTESVTFDNYREPKHPKGYVTVCSICTNACKEHGVEFLRVEGYEIEPVCELCGFSLAPDEGDWTEDDFADAITTLANIVSNPNEEPMNCPAYHD